MNVTEAVRTRQSIRAFLDKPVARADIETILDSARGTLDELVEWHGI